MKRPLVKVCGITRAEDAERALALGADFIGVILYPKSPRAVSPDAVPALLEAIPRGKRVMVDVATDVDELERRRRLGFDAYQIHFDLEEMVANVSAWAEIVGPEAFWASPRIPLEKPLFPQILMEFANTFVVDAYAKDSYGGTGQAGDNWQRFLDWTFMYQHKRWILAGGLGPSNIEEAIRITQAGIVDINSGVERSPGIKDPARLEDFFRRVDAMSSD